jgi:hypothetical protein
MAQEKSVQAQTPQDAQKDTLAATKIIRRLPSLDSLSDIPVPDGGHIRSFPVRAVRHPQPAFFGV